MESLQSEDSSRPPQPPAGVERVEELFDQYLDLRLRGETVDVQGFFAAHPELSGAERARMRRLAELLEEPPDARAADGAAAGALRDRVGPYRILGELGRGGQGAVYLAEDTRFARKVALKVLARHGLELRDDPQARESSARLKREAELVSRLDHPGICVVYEMGAEENDRYIAMRYVEGETLAKKIAAALREAASAGERTRALAVHGSTRDPADGGTPPSSGRRGVERVLALVEQCARALHAAHEAGVVHRDVKPGNIMVTPQGEPVLLDFGLARDLEQGTTALTASGGLLGTPAYMAPEQLSPARGPVDRRADVYALGVTLYECLTLARPFEAPTRELLYRSILTEEPARAGLRNAHVPRDLEVVLETALEKDPRERYPSALELAEELRRVRLREPIRARPAGFALRGARWAQRNPGLAAALGCVFLALVVGLTVARALLQESEGNRLIADAHSVLTANPRLALLLALEGEPLAPGQNANNVLLQALGALRERHRLQADTGMAWCLYSPDGRWLSTIARDGTVRVWEADTWAPVRTLEGRHEATNAAFSPDGTLLAVGALDGTCRVWRTATWEVAHTFHEPCPTVTVQGFDTAGRRLLIRSLDERDRGCVRLWDLEREQVLFEEDLRVDGAELGPRGDLLLLRDRFGARVRDVDSGATGARLEVPFPVPGPNGGLFSPDGTRLLLAWHGGAGLWDVDTGERLLELPAVEGSLGALFRPDGRRLLVVLSDGGARILDVATGERVCDLAGAGVGASLPYNRACFSPDGAAVLAPSRGVPCLWDAETGAELACFEGNEGGVVMAAFSPSGRTVVTAAGDGTVREWSLESEAQRATLHPLAGNHCHACFDPAGKRVAVGTDLGRVQVIDLDSRASREFAIPGARRLLSLAFAPDGRSVLTTLESLEDHASSWDVETGAALAVFAHPGSHVFDAEFSPDGRLVVTAGEDHTARIWEARTGNLVRELSGHASGVRSASFGRGGARVVTVCEAEGDGSVHVWDAASWTEIAVLRAPGERPTFACLSPDGGRVLAAGWWGMASVWDVASREVIQQWQASQGALTSAAWSPDGKRLLTSGGDGARLWDAATFEGLLTVSDSVSSASFSADGRWIVTTSDDSPAHIWPVDPRQRALELDPGRLTSAERARYGLAPEKEP